jgi:plasmid stabilization system protein ParE
VEKLFEAAERAAAFPLLGRAVPEAEDETVREILFRSYRLIYRVERERVLMLAVIHGARDLRGAAVKPWDVI